MPKKIIKKNSAGAVNSQKRKKTKALLPLPKKVTKEDELKLKEEAKKKQPIKNTRDFKKPTQSYL